MSKYQKAKAASRYNEACQFIVDWKSGKTCKFRAGDVVERGNGKDVGVIQFALAKYGFYQVKWFMGPKPWDFVEGIGNEIQLIKSTKPNPLKYKYSDMVPGPSSKEIDILNERLAKADSELNKNLSGRDVDRRLSAYEDALVLKKELRKLDENADKVVSEEDEDELVSVAEVDPVAEKREKLISEE